MELNEAYWSNRYLHGTATWDTGNITTPLKTYFDQLTDRHIAILIPGCGNGYEAEYLLKQGFTNVTLIDLSQALCEKLEQKFAADLDKRLHIFCGDFFDHVGKYDLVIEQTFLCALSPELRTSYARKVHALLKEKGKLVGVLFDTQFENGPPFGGNKNEYLQIFKPLFSIPIMENCYNSIGPRKGRELFIIMIRRELETF